MITNIKKIILPMALLSITACGFANPTTLPTTCPTISQAKSMFLNAANDLNNLQLMPDPDNKHNYGYFSFTASKAPNPAGFHVSSNLQDPSITDPETAISTFKEKASLINEARAPYINQNVLRCTYSWPGETKPGNWLAFEYNDQA